jgi:hypothetical protein
MKSYFEKQSWYQPVAEDVTGKLTDLEKLNVLLIQRFEEKRDEF